MAEQDVTRPHVQAALLLRELGAVNPEEPVVLELKAELAFTGASRALTCPASACLDASAQHCT